MNSLEFMKGGVKGVIKYNPDIVKLSDFEYFKGSKDGIEILDFDKLPFDPYTLEIILNLHPENVNPKLYLVILTTLEYLNNYDLLERYRTLFLSKLDTDFILPDDRHIQIYESLYGGNPNYNILSYWLLSKYSKIRAGSNHQ